MAAGMQDELSLQEYLRVLSPAEANQRTTRRLEARVGIEPTHKGFADLSLTTWVPRPTS